MRSEDLIIAIRKRREAMQENVFNLPPQNWEEFLNLKGIWIGLGQALSEIEDVRKKDYDN